MQFKVLFRSFKFSTLRRVTAYLACFGLLLLLIPTLSISLAQDGTTTTTGAPAAISTSAKTDRSQLQMVASKGFVRLIVGLDMDTFTGKSFRTLNEIDQVNAIRQAQSSLLSSLALAGVTPRNVQQYSSVPYVALTTDTTGLNTLSIMPQVNYIQLDGLNFISLDSSTYQIGAAGADGAWDMGYDGTGQTIAILDTGVDKNHEFLTGKVVSEACYSTTDTFSDPYFGTITVVSNCPGGQDTTATGSGLNCDADGCYHGTHVAGITAGVGDSFNGVAKGADLIAIQVFSKITTSLVCSYLGYDSPCITAFDSDIIGGLDRVYTLRSSYTIAAVNMSLGGGQYGSESACDSDNYPIKAITDKLRAANIAVIASSGNNGFNGSMSAPACITGVVSVGAVSDFDSMASFSNEASFMDLVAPGVSILSSLPDNSYGELSGTSMAAPHVAGAWAIMKQFLPDASIGKIEKALKKSGVKVSGTVASYPRIQVNAAINFLIKPGKPLLQSPSDTESVHITPLTFSWQASEFTDLYTLVVKNEAGDKVVKQMLAPDSCPLDLCSYTLMDPLPNGVYRWFVKTNNQYQENQSDKLGFVVDYPGAPELQQPADTAVLTDKSDWTVLQWSLVEGATSYKVAVKDTKTKLKFVKAALTDADCLDSVCTYTVTQADRDQLRNHRTYKWSVQATNDLGTSKSVKFTFSTGF